MTYAASETSATGGSPVELYEFLYQGNYFRFTSAADPITYLSQVFRPYALQRDPIATQSANVDAALTLTAFQDFPPAQLFRVQAPSAVVNLTVRREHRLDTAGEFSVIWVGKVLGAQWDESSQVKLTCESDLASLKRIGLRRLYQLGCPWVLYGPGCHLLADDFAFTLTSGIVVTGRTVAVAGLAGYPANYFAGGYLKYPSPLNGVTEVFAIRASLTGALTLALTPYGLSLAPTVTVYRGCAHTMDACATFGAAPDGNTANFGGQPYIPGTNPFAGTILF